MTPMFQPWRRIAAPLLGALALGAASLPAHAVPSFARQTGMDCAGCHVGGFGPQLTPAGIRFKLTGYTDTDGQPGKVPLSAMVVGSATRTRADQSPPPDHLKANNNVKMDEASVFLAGRLTENIGSFVQATYDGVARKASLDQADLRMARSIELGGRESIVGLSVNNNAGVQDPLNSMPVWGFPYIASPAGFGTGPASTLINGGLEHRVLGASAYALVDGHAYADLGTYRSLAPSTQRRLGLGEDPQRLGPNTYWRLAWLDDRKTSAWHAGLFGWNASLTPDRATPGPADRYRDIGADAGYQFLGTRRHVWTADASYVDERKRGGLGDTTRLHEARLASSYYFDQTWGASAGLFSTRGSDPADATQGHVLQVDWTPWGKEGRGAPAPFAAANLRLGLQYTAYRKFNGDTTGAAAHNTLYLFAWTAF
jgi:hypothetical protein